MRSIMIRLAGLATMAVMATTLPLSADVTERKIGNRSYILVDPDNVVGPAPLVLALHGGFGSAENFRDAIPLDRSAAQNGFRVAYLEGTGAGLRGKRARTWNAGRCCGPAEENRVNDVAYIQSVISQLQSQGLVSQINMVGHSNGAMMTYRFLCEGQIYVRSAVIISGSKMADGCRMAGKTNVLVLHGQKDQNVPISGGKGKGVAGANFASLDASMNSLAAAGASVQRVLLPNTGHRVKEINRTVSGGLASYVTKYMFGK